MNSSLSLSQIAYDAIKEQILMQSLLPGAPIVEEDLSRKLKMSRTPIRDAIRRLEADGLVEIVPRKGAYIKNITIKDLIMYYEVSEALEGMLAFLLAEKAKSGKLKKKEIDSLKNAICRMDSCYQEGNTKQWVVADEDFHFKMYDLCDNVVLVDYLSRIRTQFNCVSWLFTPKYIDKMQSNDEHKALIESIERGDTERARMIAQNQRKRIREVLSGLLNG